MRTPLKYIFLLLLVLPLGGCALGYYWQAMTGHMDLMRQRRPVPEVVSDPDTTETVRSQLERAQAILEFAHAELLLPDNGSYAVYADTGREYVVWNVFATDEFSLEPRTWCFPVAGCVSYRGYFSADSAKKFAAKLDADGLDTFVGGVAAYSTLGRFRDPLLNNMMTLSEYRLAGLLIHELSHQQLYVRDDSSFNESFASFVEQQGVSDWLGRAGRRQDICDYRAALIRRAAVRGLLDAARARLGELYLKGLPDADARPLKAEILARLEADYARLRGTWSEPPYYDGWFDGDLNNARLAALSTYDEYVPAFEALFNATSGSWREFYARAAALGALPPEQRVSELDALTSASESAAADPGSRGECRESANSDPVPPPEALPRS